MLITNKCLRRRLYLIAFPARTDAGRDMAYALLPSPLPGPGSVEVASSYCSELFPVDLRGDLLRNRQSLSPWRRERCAEQCRARRQ